jgi:uncharacterized membrane protein YeaQ/YmgE (transglycosylase-associated protein family)
MHIVMMLLVGLVIGAVARVLMPGRPGGLIATILLGLGGSFLAGYLGRAIGWYRGPVDGPGIIASILGAMLLLFLFRIVMGRR